MEYVRFSTSTGRLLLVVLVILVAVALSASGHDLLTALLVSTVVIGIVTDVSRRMLPARGCAQ